MVLDEKGRWRKRREDEKFSWENKLKKEKRSSSAGEKKNRRRSPPSGSSGWRNGTKGRERKRECPACHKASQVNRYNSSNWATALQQTLLPFQQLHRKILVRNSFSGSWYCPIQNLVKIYSLPHRKIEAAQVVRIRYWNCLTWNLRWLDPLLSSTTLRRKSKGLFIELKPSKTKPLNGPCTGEWQQDIMEPYCLILNQGAKSCDMLRWRKHMRRVFQLLRLKKSTKRCLSSPRVRVLATRVSTSAPNSRNPLVKTARVN